MKKKRKKKGFSLLEKTMYKIFTCLTIILVIGIIYSRATLGKINLEVLKLNDIIKEETEDNQSLEMKKNEMAALDKVQSISGELGLSYNNDNIKSVTE